jgi:NADH:ubiquinone oxidoreductase subunit 6 (subunit J)
MILSTMTFTKPTYAIENPAIGPLGSGTNYGDVLATILANIWKAAVIAGGIGFILYFVWGALNWLTAGGDKARLEESRNKMASALIGLVLLAASYAIITLAGELLNIEFLQTLQFNFPET